MRHVRLFYLFVLLLVLACSTSIALADVELNETNFPDVNFRKYITDSLFDRDANGVLTKTEADNVKMLFCDNLSISDFTGIEHFSMLTGLWCAGNQLTSLDVSKNRYLTALHCNNNQLTSLNLSNNDFLTHLSCASNQLTSLDVSISTRLVYLECESNQLTQLDLSKNTALLAEIAKYEPQIESGCITIGNKEDGRWNPLVLSVDSSVAVLPEGTIPRLIEINEINFPDENFRKFIIDSHFDKDGNGVLTAAEADNVRMLNCDNLSISDFTGIEHFSKLTRLWCAGNQLTSLDVSKNRYLTALHCNNNQLTSLNLSNNDFLTHLSCASNQLTSLDVSISTRLVYLECESNQLTQLDLSKNTALLAEIAKYETHLNSGCFTIGNKEDGRWDPFVLSVDTSVSVLPEGTVPGLPSFILPASVTTVESGAFTGLANKVFQLPASVTFIADDAFDPSASILAPKDSYAETRCRELGLKVFTTE